MKLPGDSAKQQAVSHEMMQRSLQSQRRVVQRVGLLEDRVDQIESAEVEPGVDIGDLADGAKKIAKGIGKSIGKNAQLLGDKAGKAAQAAGKAALDATGKGLKSAADATGKGIKDAASATGKGIKKGIGKAGKGLTDVGKGLRDFIKDRAKVAVSPISEFGLLEMTRQRIRLSLLDSMSDECPTCKGAGRIMSRETLITRIDHWLRRYKSKNRKLKLKLELHPEIADFMKNNKKALRGLMWQNFTYITVEGNPKVHRDEFKFLDTNNNGKVIEHVSIEHK